MPYFAILTQMCFFDLMVIERGVFMPIQWMEHKGVSILYSDFSNIRNTAEAVKLIETVDELYATKGKGVRHLMNVENTALSPEFMELAKQLGKKYQPLVYKDAFVGISPLKSVMLKGFLLFTGSGGKTKVFSNIGDAMNWLAE